MSDRFAWLPADAFAGETYDPKRDHARLKGQLRRVFDVMKDGQWRTLPRIQAEIRYIRDSEAAISARLRDLRKDKFGAHTVERKSLGGGLFAYRLIVNGGKS